MNPAGRAPTMPVLRGGAAGKGRAFCTALANCCSSMRGWVSMVATLSVEISRRPCCQQLCTQGLTAGMLLRPSFRCGATAGCTCTWPASCPDSGGLHAAPPATFVPQPAAAVHRHRDHRPAQPVLREVCHAAAGALGQGPARKGCRTEGCEVAGAWRQRFEVAVWRPQLAMLPG